MTLLLMAGLLIVFAGVALALVSAGSWSSERSAVKRTLASIEASGPLPQSMREDIDPPFQSRVIVPLRAQALSLGAKLTPGDWTERTRRRLDFAGNPAGWDPERVLAAKVLWGISLGGVALLASLSFSWGVTGLAGTVGLAALGFLGPDLWLKSTADKRAKEMRRALADSLDLLTISVESGLAFDAAMQQVADNTTGPLAGEFKRTLHEIQLGTSRADALKALAERSNVSDLNYVVSSLVQADKLGIPIAQVLRAQTSEMRLKRKQYAEEAAAKLPVKILAPVMLCIFPAVFVVIVGPAGIKITDYFSG